VGLLTELHASEERIRAFIRPLDDRIRMLEQKESSSSTQLANLRAEIGKDMDAFSKASAAQSEAIQELTNVVTGLRAQLDYATRTSFGNPKTGG
jgi:predicted  nucleic acid-binding Zn-ribbon protein